jgi:hypothetical protein
MLVESDSPRMLEVDGKCIDLNEVIKYPHVFRPMLEALINDSHPLSQDFQELLDSQNRTLQSFHYEEGL